MDKCSLQTKYGDIVCRDGQLWGLTYSEMGPPDSRQCIGPCPQCLQRYNGTNLTQQSRDVIRSTKKSMA